MEQTEILMMMMMMILLMRSESLTHYWADLCQCVSKAVRGVQRNSKGKNEGSAGANFEKKYTLFIKSLP